MGFMNDMVSPDSTLDEFLDPHLQLLLLLLSYTSSCYERGAETALKKEGRLGGLTCEE